MSQQTYHVGLLAVKTANGHKAIFQFRKCIDFLDCEILEYLGERVQSKAEARRKAAEARPLILASLNRQFPRKHFTSIVID